MEQLIATLHAIRQMSPALEALLRRMVCPMTYKKGDVIHKIGKICSQIFFIETGLVRSFYYDENGKAITDWFMKEGDFCIAVLSYFRQQPSLETHIALEDCVCWGITWAENEAIYEEYPEFNWHGRVITREYYCRGEERRQDVKLKDPLVAFELLMQKSPELLQRVPKKLLASYIGVSERTFDDLPGRYRHKQLLAAKRR